MPVIKATTSSLVNFRYSKGDVLIYNNMQIHPFFEIFYFMEGSAEFISNRIRKNMCPNQLIIIPSRKYHLMRIFENTEGYERCVIDILPSFEGYNVLESMFSECEILELDSSKRITENFKHLIKCIDTMNEEDFTKVLSSVVTDILYILKYNRPDTVQSPSKQPDFLRELIRYIDDNYKSTVNLKNIAEKFNYSVSHISHKFKENYGISIKNYIIQKRLNSIHMKIQQGANVQKTCFEHGFSNYSTFFRLYKKTFGMPPSDNKKQG